MQSIFVVWTTLCISLLLQSMSLHSICAAEGAEMSFSLEHKSDQEGEGIGLEKGVCLGTCTFGWQCALGVGRHTNMPCLGRKGPF